MTRLVRVPRHWKAYAIEGWALGCFMLVACGATALVLHPDSPLAGVIPSVPILQRAVLGLWMGLTLIALVYSPWGHISGAHMNPAFTLTFAGLRTIYFLAPPAGMLLAAASEFRRGGATAAPCGKMMHARPCLFCDHVAEQETSARMQGTPR